MQRLPPLSQLQFPAQYLEVAEAFVQSKGGGVKRLRQACGQTDDQAGPPAWIDHPQLLAMLDIALAHCTPDEPPAVQILKYFPVTALGPLGMLAITSLTVGEALDAALRFHPLVMPLFGMTRLPDSPEGAHIQIDPMFGRTPHDTLLAELTIGVLHSVAAFTQIDRPAMHVCFSHQSPWPAEAYVDCLGAAPRFGAPAHRFFVSHELLRQPLTTGNRITRSSLEPLLLRGTSTHPAWSALTQKVRQRLMAGLQQGQHLHSEPIACQLAMSPRTLSRRLQDEGTSFKRLSDEVRLEHAERLLSATHLSIQDVARRTGFADASSFIRAFKRATGRTPAALREHMTDFRV